MYTDSVRPLAWAYRLARRVHEHSRILAALKTYAPDGAVKQALRDHLEAVRSIADSKLDDT
jgi:DNA-binding GntR family transcriptional regulator